MPHCWLMPGDAESVLSGKDATLVSTLDIVAGKAGEPPKLTLFVEMLGSDKASSQRVGKPGAEACQGSQIGQQAWIQAAELLQLKYGPYVPLRVVKIMGPTLADGGAAWGGPPAGCPSSIYIDVHRSWCCSMSLPPASVLLVRPDGHVAWHGSACMPSNGDARARAAEFLEQALQMALGGVPACDVR